MRIQDIMSTPVVTIGANATIGAAREQLRVNGIQHLAVMQGKKVVGIVSDRDLIERADDMLVSAIMHREVATIDPDATLRHAAGVMNGRAVGCLLVFDESKLAGIVTGGDLLQALANGSAHPQRSKERMILKKRGPRKHGITSA